MVITSLTRNSSPNNNFLDKSYVLFIYSFSPFMMKKYPGLMECVELLINFSHH